MQQLYTAFRQNVIEYPALADALATKLGVSSEALDRLGVGFDPTTGTWIFPEWDEDRNLIGLLRRYPEGGKCCIPDIGCRRGATYDIQHDFTDDPIIVVEGASDTAAALTLGCQAIGRHSATGGFDHIKALTAGKVVLVVGENDEGVGATSASSLAQQLKETCKAVSSCLPPFEYKDLRQWVASGTLTKEDLEGYCDGGSVPAGSDLHLTHPEVRAIDLADHWLKATYSRGSLPLLRNYRGDWYVFSGSCYELSDPDEVITAPLHQHYRNVTVSRPSKTGKGSVIGPIDITTARLNSIKKALLADCGVRNAPPCWFSLDATTEIQDIVCFQNGYLDTNDWSFHAATPSLFTTATVPYRYDPNAACPRWEQFLQEVFPDDPQKAVLLQEWMGYLLVPDMQYEKYMMMIGPSGGGKGTTLHAMMSVLGQAYTVAMSLSDFAYQFGMEKLIGKYAAFASDAHITDRADKTRIIEFLKALVGRDSLSVHRKFKTEVTKQLVVRITMAADHIPELPDEASALQRRLLAIRFTESFRDDPDPRLKDTLAKEAQGICNWALGGLKRLRETNEFTVPPTSTELQNEIHKANSPIQSFIDECCTLHHEQTIATQALFDAWCGYCNANRAHIMSFMRFDKAVRMATPGLTIEEKDGIMAYHGIGIREDAEQRYVRY